MAEDAFPPGIPRPGELVAGRYRVRRLLGAGGMGVVLEAEQLPLGRKVALKMPLAHVAARKNMDRRFLREAQAPAALRSEHVARVLEVAETDAGAPFIAMELLEGQDLGSVLAERGRVGVEEACDWLLHACEALAEAHREGLVHRDIKPHNLFLTHRADGSMLVKVLDFGIVRSVEPGAEITGTAPEILGSPSYMAPEQLLAPREAGPQVDVWGLGVVLYRMVSGELPFAGDALSVGARIATEDPAPLPPALDAVVGPIVRRCLARRPEDRFAGMVELAAALGPLASEEGRRYVERVARVASAPRVARPESPGVVVTEGAGRVETTDALAATQVMGADGPETIDMADVAPAPRPAAATTASSGAGTTGESTELVSAITPGLSSERSRAHVIVPSLVAVALAVALGVVLLRDQGAAQTRAPAHVTSASVARAPEAASGLPAMSASGPLVSPAPPPVASPAGAPAAGSGAPVEASVRPQARAVAAPAKASAPPSADDLLDRRH